MPPSAFRKAVKQALEVTEGSVNNAATILGMHPAELSRALNHRGLYPWWRKFKDAKVLERQRAAKRRAYQRRKLRALLEAGYDQATAEYLASQDLRCSRRALHAPTVSG
jgi:hypothetical protein